MTSKEYVTGPDGTRFLLPVFPLRAGEATAALDTDEGDDADDDVDT